MKNSRVWEATQRIVQGGEEVILQLGTLLATTVEDALKAARRNWPHAGKIRVKVKR